MGVTDKLALHFGIVNIVPYNLPWVMAVCLTTPHWLMTGCLILRPWVMNVCLTTLRWVMIECFFFFLDVLTPFLDAVGTLQRCLLGFSTVRRKPCAAAAVNTPKESSENVHANGAWERGPLLHGSQNPVCKRIARL